VLKENRYSRQILLPEIGAAGQKRLQKANVLVIGCGALGTHCLSFLVRAGIGNVTVVDRDVVDITNLQRQTLFGESDVGRPKAKVAEQKLREVNSEPEIAGIVADVNYSNIERLIKNADLVLDATDNMETRFLVNDACVRNHKPWIYAGAVGTTGMVMDIVPGGPCLRCVFASLPLPGELPTCDTVGIVNTLPAAVASIEATQAYKILLGKEHAKGLIIVDLWSEDLQKINIKRNPECECCGKKNFEFLQAKRRKLVVSMCGRNAVQIVPAKAMTGDLAQLGRRLSRLGDVKLVEGVLRFTGKDVEVTVFSDGRTIVSGTTDLTKAKNIFSKYVGD